LALIDARKGDVFVVPRLICLSNSFKRLAHVLKELQSRDIHFCILSEPMDTRGKDGHLVIPALLHLIESRRNIKSEETRAGLAAARRRGRLGGRPAALAADRIALAQELLADRRYIVSEVAERVGVSRSTLYKKGIRRGRSVPVPPGSAMRQSS
jgi:DNA invertase Pin-like site-specific DNA recombinase